VSSPSEVWGEPRLPKGFPLFSAFRTLDTTILLIIVDCYAAIGGEDPVPPSLAYASALRNFSRNFVTAMALK